MSRFSYVLLLCLCSGVCVLSKTLQVKVPENAKPGEHLKIEHEGKMFSITIPASAKPGAPLYVDADKLLDEEAAAPPPGPATRTLNVTVPEGAKAGHVLYIDYNQRRLQVSVPKGVKPGDVFQVAVHVGKKLDTEIKEDNGVLVLHRENFDTALETYPLLAIDFYAPWCGHCKELAPVWEQAAKALKDMEKTLPQPVIFAKLDASTAENEPIADAFGVEGYPAIKIFRHGAPFEYRGERTAAAIITEMTTQSQPALILIDGEESLKQLQRRRQILMLGIFNETTNLDLINPFSHTAEILRLTTAFGVVTDPVVLSKLGLPLEGHAKSPRDLFPSVFMLRYYDRQIVPYDVNGNRSALTPELVDVGPIGAWVAKNQLPDILHLTSEEVHGKFLKSELKTKVAQAKKEGRTAKQVNKTIEKVYIEHPWSTKLFMSDFGDVRGEMLKVKLVAVLENKSQLLAITPQLTRMAKETEGEVSAAYFVASEFESLRKSLNVQPEDIPALVAVSVPQGDKFVVPFSKVKLRSEDAGETMSFEAIDRFVTDMRADFIKPTIMSEPETALGDRADNREKIVVKITGKTFLQDVVEAPAEVFLKIYAPWCAHCKKFAPVFDQAAALFEKEDRIWFADLDLTTNELPKHLHRQVKSYPTMLFFGGDKPRNVSVYDRSLDSVADLVDFVGTFTRLNKSTGFQGSPMKLNEAAYAKILAKLAAGDSPAERVMSLLLDTTDGLAWYISEMKELWEANDTLLEVGGVALTARMLATGYAVILSALVCMLLYFAFTPAKVAPKHSVSEVELANIRQQMVAVYKEHAPANVEKVDPILKSWLGREHLIVPALQQKYGTNDTDRDGGSSDNDYDIVEKEEEEEGEGKSTPAGESTAESDELETKKDK